MAKRQNTKRNTHISLNDTAERCPDVALWLYRICAPANRESNCAEHALTCTPPQSTATAWDKMARPPAPA
eukprot:11154994-Lingulodinium_polyedra.AAC.1